MQTKYLEFFDTSLLKINTFSLSSDTMPAQLPPFSSDFINKLLAITSNFLTSSPCEFLFPTKSPIVLSKDALLSSLETCLAASLISFNNAISSKKSQDKGHQNQFKALLEQQKNGGSSIIPFDEIINTTRASFAAVDSLTEGKWITIK